MGWFKRKTSSEHPLRAQALALSASALGLTPSTDFPRYYGVIIDQKLPVGAFTLAAFAEGSVSLYWGDKGGIIGAGEHAHIRAKALRMLSLAQEIDSAATNEGEVVFTLKGFQEDAKISTTMKALVGSNDAMHNLYAAAQDVITEIRVLQQGRG
jgi:hypothetical protein